MGRCERKSFSPFCRTPLRAYIVPPNGEMGNVLFGTSRREQPLSFRL
jgi:hypothetical protein